VGDTLITQRRVIGTPERPTLGTFVKLPSLEIAEILATAGFDFVVIDTEHALLSVRDVYAMVVAYSRMGVDPLVRISDHGYGDAQRYLDAGAAGVLVPHVSNGQQAEAVMTRLLFPPEGTRGAGYTGRAGLWGALPGGQAEYVRAGQEDILRVAMVEDTEAVDGIEAILVAPGVDAIFIGPGDLSMTMGLDVVDQAVQDAVTRSIEACVHMAVPVGTVVQVGEQLRLRASQGCSFLLVSNDAGMLVSASRQIVADARAAMPQTVGP
jgi:2-keto-3-deoxy-L-rhamnonate aldolase RhmA